MIEPTMPTTIPSPVDRGEFRFVAVDKDGRSWRWDDEEMAWVVATTDRKLEPEEGDTA